MPPVRRPCYSKPRPFRRITACRDRVEFTRADGRHAELQPQGGRAALAAILAGTQDLSHAGPVRQAEVLHPRHVPVPQRRRPPRRPPRGLHRHRHPGPLQADARLQRPAPDGLGRLRPAGRAVRHRDRHAPPRHHREEHRHVPPANPDARLQLRLGPRSRYDRSELFPLDAVDFPGAVRHLVRRGAEKGPADRGAADSRRGEEAGRGGDSHLSGRQKAGVSDRGAGELVPGTGHGAGERRSHGRQVGARRASRGADAAAAVDAAHHGLCGTPAVGPGAGRLVGSDQGDAAQLDRQERGGGGRFRAPGWPRSEGERSDPRFHHSPRHAVRRDLHGAGPRTPPGRCDHHARAALRGEGVPGGRRARATWSAPSWPRRKPAFSPGPTPSTR